MKNLILIIGLVCGLSAHNLYAEETQQVAIPEVQYSEAELAQLLAPIALYPDSLLTHILIASTYPLEIIEADRWLVKNPDLSAEDIVKKSEDKLWDPSIMALLPFPTIVNQLSTELEWTQKLGDAFLTNQEDVLASVQSLRQKADEAGNLEEMPNVTVVREVETIIIKPAVPEVIYVPYYDTTVVYGHWYWNHYPPVYWAQHNHYSHHHGHYYWGTPVHLSVGIFFGSVHWNTHHIIVASHHNSRYYGHHYNHYKKHYTTQKRHYSKGKKHYASTPNKNQWKHNPSHRKGVAYRNDRLAKTYKSNRPSVQKTQYVRSQERKVTKSVSTKKLNNTKQYAQVNKSKVTANKTRHQALTEKVKSNNKNYNSDKKSVQRTQQKSAAKSAAKSTVSQSKNRSEKSYSKTSSQRAVQGSNKSQTYNNKSNTVNKNKSSAKTNTQKKYSTQKTNTNSKAKSNSNKSYKSSSSSRQRSSSKTASTRQSQRKN